MTAKPTGRRTTKTTKLNALTEGTVWKKRDENRFARIVKGLQGSGDEFGEVLVVERVGSPGRYSSKPVTYTARRFLKIFALYDAPATKADNTATKTD